MTTDSQMASRAGIAEQAYDIALAHTESFEEDGIGPALAYLMGAILKDDVVDIHPDSHVDTQKGLCFLLRLYVGIPGTHGILRHFAVVKKSRKKKRHRG